VWDTRAPAAPAPSQRPYDPGATYRVGDAVAHPRFGDGVVARVIDGRKVSIAFANGERALAHGARKEVAPAPPAALAHPFRDVLLAGSVALLEDEKRVTALDARTGVALWATDGPAELRAADAHGVVLHQNADPQRRATTWSLVELEPRTGRERWFFPSSGVHFVALGERCALATRIIRKGWVDREADREVVAIERAPTAPVRWRRPDRGSPTAITATHGLYGLGLDDRPRPDLDLATGQDAPTSA
jgi:hypothetical protein